MQFMDLMESAPSDLSRTQLVGGAAGERRAAALRQAGQYETAFNEACQLFERVLDGDRYAALMFEEAMSTSDFPLLFGDIVDRAMVGAFREYPSQIEQIARRREVSDFRNVRDFALNGAEGVLSEVPQLTEYPESALTEARDSWAVSKYGRVLRFAWETLVNDDLDALRDIPNRLGKAARRTRQKLITQQYVTTTGPHGSLYTGGNANIVTGNPVLSTTALATAFSVLHAQTDSDGEPVFFDAVYLVVPPALEVTANNIVNALQIEMTDGGGLTNQRLIAKNWLAGRIKVIVDPYIPIVASSSNGSTSWFLFGDPASTRPALSYGVLRGHEEPEIWVKSPNATRVGGGPVGAEEGDFETDAVGYRVRYVTGATRHTTGGAKTTVASNGSGS